MFLKSLIGVGPLVAQCCPVMLIVCLEVEVQRLFIFSFPLDKTPKVPKSTTLLATSHIILVS
jgi:hypothetical protein